MFRPTEEYKQKVREWKAAATADGWSCVATYGSEDIERACSLSRDGFKAMILTREPQESRPAEYSLDVWGPDRLALTIPFPYSFETLRQNLQLCHECHQMKPATHRVAFAGRACAECLPAAKARDEKPGWCD